MKRIYRWLGLMVLGMLLLGCGADAMLGEVGLAAAVNGEGKVDPAATTFKPGETVYLSLELTEAYEGMEVKATWRRSEEVLVTENLSTLRAADSLNPVVMVFKLETGTDWPAGTYYCDYFVPDQGTQTLEFTLK